jgi:flavin-dependent dehydrogenase
MKNVTISIIGAGPGGQIASLYLAKQGIPSILIDRETHPRHKACADILTSRAIRILHDLDEQLPIDEILNHEILQIKGTVVHLPQNKTLSIDFLALKNLEHLPSCFSIPRVNFDNWLYQKVKTSPLIDLVENTHIQRCERDEKNKEWQIFNSEGKLIIKSKILVIATGSNSSLPFKIGGLKQDDRHFAVGIRAYFRNIASNAEFPQHTELFLDPKLFPGGFYIAPFQDGSFNVNIVMRSDIVKKKKINLNKLFYEFIAENPTLRDRFKNAEQVGKLLGGALHLGTQTRPISGDGYVLVGDAGGLIDLMSGNGIPQAMISGKIAAEQIAMALQKNDFSANALKDYDKKVFKAIKNDLQMGRILSPFLGTESFSKFSFFVLNFLASKKGFQSFIQKLLYSPNVLKVLINPKNYWHIIFSKK